MSKSRSTLLAAVVLAYSALRAWRLTEGCLWFDEIFSVHAAEHPWNEIIQFVAKDLIHPPLFYVLLKVWISLTGDGLLWVRLLPFACALLALGPFLMLCKELKVGTITTTVGMALLAMNGSLIKYSQEVRMYSLLLFLSVTSTWLFTRYYFRGKSFWALVLVNTLLVYTHYFGWFVVASEVAVIALMQRIKLARALMMMGIVLAAFIPWLIAVVRFAEPGPGIEQNIGWMSRPNLVAVFELVCSLVCPIYAQRMSTEPASLFPIALFLLSIAASAAIVHHVQFWSIESRDRPLLLLILVILPLTAVFVLSWALPVSIWGTRHLAIVYAPALLLLAIYATEIRPVPLSTILTVLILASGLPAFVYEVYRERPRPIWCAWEMLAADLSAQQGTGEGRKRLFVFEDLVAYHYWFADRQVRDFAVNLVKGVDGVPNDPAYFLPRGFSEIKTARLERIEDKDIWLSFRSHDLLSREGDAFPRFEVPVTNFENLGYHVTEAREIKLGFESAWLVRMKGSD